MLNIPTSIQNLFKTDGVFKNFRVHFPNGEHSDLTNSDIVAESVKFTESICSKEVFQFGLSERPTIEFECVNVPNIYGVSIECGIEIDTSSLTAQQIADIQSGSYDGTLVLEADSDIGFGYYRIPYGSFIVQSCPRSHGAMWRRRVTAYGTITENTKGYDRFLQSLFPNNVFCVGVNAFSAMYDESLLTELTTTESTITGTTFTLNHCYNSAGVDYQIQITNVHRKSVSGSGIPSFVKATYTETEAQNNYAFGERIAACINSLGYDLTYNNNRNQQFSSNLDMLQHRAGELFAPTINQGITDTSSGTVYTDISNDFILNSGELTPYIATGGAFPDAHSINGDTLRYTSGSIVYVYQFDINSTISIWQNGSQVNAMGVGQYAFTMNPTISHYSIASVGEVLQIPQTSEISKGIFSGGWVEYFTGYSFTNSATAEKTINDICEVNASFLLSDRAGKYTQIHLLDYPVATLNRSMFSDLWYDDFSISAIGTVSIDFGENQHIDISLGNGGTSVYEFSDNAIFDNIASADIATAESTIRSLIANNFTPYAAGAQTIFLPTEAETIGLPYLQAGDRVYFYDGNTVANTIILTHTISGIQTLTDSITAKGGELKGDS